MNPNTANQIWSRWTWAVVPARGTSVRAPQVRENCARFARKAFGSATEMKIDLRKSGSWRIDLRTEGHPAHDPGYKNWMLAQWDKFLRAGFGADAKVSPRVRVEAGSKQDGRPADQLIILPTVSLED